MIRRDWTKAREKLSAEKGCRLMNYRGATCEGRIHAAHVSGRKLDRPMYRGGPIEVHPLDVVPLCEKHHRRYDEHRLDLLPVLTLEEQARAVLQLGGIEAARRRLIGQRETPPVVPVPR